MKKILLLLLLLLLFLITSCSNNYNKELRIRIIAEDNSTEAIQQKEYIKSIIKGYFDNNSVTYNTLSPEKISSLLKNDLSKDLYDCLIINRCMVNYPAKAYNGKLIAAGSYDTLLIKIGEGKGKNFWTLLYPEYFGFEFCENNEVKFESYFFKKNK